MLATHQRGKRKRYPEVTMCRFLEASSGIEPGYKDLQAFTLCCFRSAISMLVATMLQSVKQNVRCLC